MLTAVILGQVDLAADNLSIVIFGLLVVAALLALLTVWYWLHTKPRPLVITASSGSTSSGSAPAAAPKDQPTAAADADVFERAIGDDFDPDSVWADSPSATAPVVPKEVIAPVPSPLDRLDDDEEMSADEWLSITGPDQVADETR